MTLEHYPGMTDAEMTRIAADATARWPIDDGLLAHRYGTLRPGDPIVLVIAAARHRADAFAAVEAMMDRLKTEAAFWKKELYSDASENWVDAEQADTDRAARWE
jgi:molybdopterin synthase catalytic subunit